MHAGYFTKITISYPGSNRVKRQKKIYGIDQACPTSNRL
jgi:hypothetical protein